MNQLERVARALVEATGFDPDELVEDQPAWHWWIPRAKAAIDAMGPEWQPIETAPKDGTRILMRSPKGRMADGEWGNYKVWSWPYVMVEPTHWMPLPEPPK